MMPKKLRGARARAMMPMKISGAGARAMMPGNCAEGARARAKMQLR